MVKDIVHDTFILSMKSSDATIDDISVANDLLDTLKYHKDKCVGMAANMIGVHKRILVLICNDNSYLTQKLDSFRNNILLIKKLIKNGYIFTPQGNFYYLSKNFLTFLIFNIIF